MPIKSAPAKLVFLLLLSGIFALYSCINNGHSKKEILFKTLTHSDKIHLFGNENFPALSMDLKINQAADTVTNSLLNQAILQAYFDTIYQANSSPESLLQLYNKLAADNYLTMESFYAADSAEMGASYNWQIIKNNEINFQKGNIVCFSVESYLFSGGAHGNTMTQYYIFDLSEQKILQAKDIFDLNQCQLIKDLQKEWLTKSGENPASFSLEGLKCDSNLSLNDSGFIFHYDHYEIASYAAGSIDIFISFGDSRKFLRSPGFLEQFKK
jgi:hypothetical protein